MIGKTISHYRILAKLGEGGMGVVYKAEDTRLKRTVSLKFLTTKAVGTPEKRARFQLEAQAAAALSHPNICTIYEIDEVDGHPFIAMEYLEGQDLKDKIASQTVDLAEAVDICRQIADGLQEAHEKGVVHRDIKPGNIMLTPTGQAKILDFGIAKLADQPQITRTGSIPGTPIYMSPERIQGQEATPRSDLWALGAVFFELITGSPPYAGDFEAAVNYSILHDDPPEPSKICPGIPAALDTITAGALARDPEARYKSCREFRNALDGLESARRGRRGPGPRAGLAFPSHKRQILKKIALGALGAMVVAAAAAIWFFYPFLTNPDLSPQTYQKSLAVLLFRDLSEGTDNRYFSDGLTEELITRLTRIGDLDVKSRTDVLRFRDRSASLEEMAEALEVDAILEGSVRRHEGQIRVNVQLIETGSNRLLWTESYAEKLDDFFGVQDQIATKIAQALELNLSGAERRNIHKRPSANIEAYDRYLQAKAALTTWTNVGFNQAETLLDEAIERDGGFADAYALLAFLNVLRTYFDYSTDISVLETAAANSERALDLDAENEVALLSSAGASMLRVQDGQDKLSLLESRRLIVRLKKILALNPRSLLGNLGMAHYYEWFKHDLERAKLHFMISLNTAERIADLEPGNRMASGIAAQCAGVLARIAHQEKNLEYAFELLAKAREFSPHVVRSYIQAMRYHMELGQIEEATFVAMAGTEKVTDASGLGRLYLFLAQIFTDHQDPTQDPVAWLELAQDSIGQGVSDEIVEFCAVFTDLCRQHGEITRAEYLLAEAEAMNSGKTIGYQLILGSLWSQEKKDDLAAVVFRDALARSGKATDSLAAENQARGVLMTAISLDKLGRPAEADSLTRYWAEFNTSNSWLREVIKLYAGRGDAAPILEDMTTGTTTNSRLNRVATLYYLGMHAKRQGDPGRAKLLLEQAADTYTGFDEYAIHLFHTELISARIELARE